MSEHSNTANHAGIRGNERREKKKEAIESEKGAAHGYSDLSSVPHQHSRSTSIIIIHAQRLVQQ